MVPNYIAFILYRPIHLCISVPNCLVEKLNENALFRPRNQPLFLTFEAMLQSLSRKMGRNDRKIFQNGYSLLFSISKANDQTMLLSHSHIHYYPLATRSFDIIESRNL